MANFKTRMKKEINKYLRENNIDIQEIQRDPAKFWELPEEIITKFKELKTLPDLKPTLSLSRDKLDLVAKLGLKRDAVPLRVRDVTGESFSSVDSRQLSQIIEQMPDIDTINLFPVGNELTLEMIRGEETTYNDMKLLNTNLGEKEEICSCPPVDAACGITFEEMETLISQYLPETPPVIVERDEDLTRNRPANFEEMVENVRLPLEEGEQNKKIAWLAGKTDLPGLIDIECDDPNVEELKKSFSVEQGFLVNNQMGVGIVGSTEGINRIRNFKEGEKPTKNLLTMSHFTDEELDALLSMEGDFLQLGDNLYNKEKIRKMVSTIKMTKTDEERADFSLLFDITHNKIPLIIKNNLSNEMGFVTSEIPE